MKCDNICEGGGQLVKLDGQLFYGGSRRLYEYIELEDQWKSMPSVGKWEFGIGICSRKLAVIGGKNLTYDATKDVLLYDKENKSWVQGTPMIEECVHPFVISITDGLIVMGATTDGNNRVQVFQNKEDKWYFGNPLPKECKKISSAAHNGGTVFISKDKSVWYTDIKDLIQTQNSSSTEGHSWMQLRDSPNTNALLCIFNGVLLAVGGLKEPHNERTVYAYSFTDQKWEFISTMPLECYCNDTAAIELPERQELMLLEASKQSMIFGRVAEYNSYLHYKICTGDLRSNKNSAIVPDNPFKELQDIVESNPSLGKILAQEVATFLAVHHSDSLGASKPLSPAGIPTLPQLLCFSAKKLNIPLLIGTKYAQFGILLLKDNSGAVVDSLENQYGRNSERINIAILYKWLQTKDTGQVTWSTLIDVLYDIEMAALAGEIEMEIMQDHLDID